MCSDQGHILISRIFEVRISQVPLPPSSLSRNSASLPTKVLCFTRSSPLIHQLPAQYLNEAQVAEIGHQTLCDLVSPDPSQLVLCKLSSLLSQSSVQQMLRGFVQSDTAMVSFCVYKNVCNLCVCNLCVCNLCVCNLCVYYCLQ